jgi:hypothetical protein
MKRKLNLTTSASAATVTHTKMQIVEQPEPIRIFQRNWPTPWQIMARHREEDRRKNHAKEMRKIVRLIKAGDRTTLRKAGENAKRLIGKRSI